MMGWRRKSRKADLRSFIARLHSSLIQRLLGLAFLVEIFRMKLLAIYIKVLVKNKIESCLSSGVVSVGLPKNRNPRNPRNPQNLRNPLPKNRNPQSPRNPLRIDVG